MRRRWGWAATATLLVALAACSPASTTPAAAPASTPEPTTSGSEPPPVKEPPSQPLRPGERFVDLAMPTAYPPKAPTYGTDDYRCFLLDPHLTKSAFVTGVNVLPGRPDLVHHVILFHVGPDQVAQAEQADAGTEGEGWTCFGGTGLDTNIGTGLDSAPWLAAWAPGGGESVFPMGTGILMQPGSRIIMQVHYNLLAGSGDDLSSARLRLTSGSAGLQPLHTMLLPAPVELPCRPAHADEPLCDRDKAIADVIGRFGPEAGFTISGLQLLCGGPPISPGPVQSCDRRVTQPGVIRAIAGHMHLLGRSIRIELNPGRPDARTLLSIHPWNFDDQRAVPLRPPARIEPGDTLRVTCRHSQRMRDLLPALAGQPERYVVWGEGTTDEMCLGIALVTRH